MIERITQEDVEKLKHACPTYRDFDLGTVLNKIIEEIEDIRKYASPIKETQALDEYFYSTKFDILDYEYASEYFKNNEEPEPVGACSGVRNGDFFGRNFDWIYDNGVEFGVTVSHTNKRYASFGIASNVPNISIDTLTSGEYVDTYKLIPFKICDGFNEKGVTASMNVVPTDLGENEKSIPLIEERESICNRALIRYILDNFSTATEAVEYIRDYISIYPDKSLLNMHYEIHYMIADSTKTYLLEIVDNSVEIIDVTETPYMTNFYRYGTTLNDDGTVYTPETQEGDLNAEDYNGITSLGAGLERFNLIVENYDSADTKSGMQNLMKSLRYTNAYKEDTDPFWYSELVGIGNLNVKSEVEDFSVAKATALEYFENRSRNPEDQYYGTWQTTHSVVYDMDALKAYVTIQEDDDKIYEFELEV